MTTSNVSSSTWRSIRAEGLDLREMDERRRVEDPYSLGLEVVVEVITGDPGDVAFTIELREVPHRHPGEIGRFGERRPALLQLFVRPLSTPIPADVRRHLDIGAGDKLRWNVDEDDGLTVEVVHQREGVFDDFEPVDAGETDAVAAEREFGDE